MCQMLGKYSSPDFDAIRLCFYGTPQIRGSIVVSISACHAEDPGSIPGRGVLDALMGLFIGTFIGKSFDKAFFYG